MRKRKRKSKSKMWFEKGVLEPALTGTLFVMFVLLAVVLGFEWASGCGEPGGSCIWLGG
jgi:hypothetical protein